MLSKQNSRMAVAIIGAGFIGKKRALALPKGVKLSLVCDTDSKRGMQFAKEFGCQYEPDWKKVVADSAVNSIIISTTNNWLAPIAKEAILKGKHTLIEKPGAKNLGELNSVCRAYKKNPVVVMFGYNHRYHPAIMESKKIVDSKKFGEVLFIRARYGHGGRLGYEKEWRFQKEIAGGGELLDQGVHLIDLICHLIGEMDVLVGLTSKLYWESELEDSAFFILKNKKNQIAHLSATCIDWKNIFSFEIMLQKAKLQMDGLGRSYGTEKLTLYKKNPVAGPPDVKEIVFEEDDNSWNRENKIFFNRIRSGDNSEKALIDACYVLKTVEKIYLLNQKRSKIRVK